jgi:hypothetical protein
MIHCYYKMKNYRLYSRGYIDTKGVIEKVVLATRRALLRGTSTPGPLG